MLANVLTAGVIAGIIGAASSQMMASTYLTQAKQAMRQEAFGALEIVSTKSKPENGGEKLTTVDKCSITWGAYDAALGGSKVTATCKPNPESSIEGSASRWVPCVPCQLNQPADPEQPAT